MKEIELSEAWDKLLNGNIIISKNTNYSYKIEKCRKEIKLKFYNPVMERWQPCNYFSTEELIGEWYIATNKA